MCRTEGSVPVRKVFLKTAVIAFRRLALGALLATIMVGSGEAQEVLGSGLGVAPSVTSTHALVAEIPDIISFNLFVMEGDTTPTLSVPRQPPASLNLSALQQELRFAMMWLLEGAPSYDRAGTLRAHPGDSVAMRRALLTALQADEAFTRPVLELGIPLLRARGIRVTDGPLYEPVELTERDVLALAARFIQVSEDGRGLTVCAKPHLLRGVAQPRNPAIEAWVYSAVRSALERGEIMRVAGQSLSSAANMSRDEMEKHMWTSLEESDVLRGIFADLELRSEGWAPVLVQR